MTRHAIVFDGESWFVRRIRASAHELRRDEMVYYCDQPISGPHATLAEAAASSEEKRREEEK